MITPFYVTEQDEVWGDTKALSTLVGPDDEVVPEESTYFQNLVINFTFGCKHQNRCSIFECIKRRSGSCHILLYIFS